MIIYCHILTVSYPHPFSLSEVPESHVVIASNTDALMQLTCISLSPSMRISSAQIVATLFLCLANTTETHHSVAHSVIISRLLDACSPNIQRTLTQGDDMELERLLLK